MALTASGRPRSAARFEARRAALRRTRPSEARISSLELVVEEQQGAADNSPTAHRDDAGGDPVPLMKIARTGPFDDPDGITAADQVAQRHGLARCDLAHFVQAQHRPAQPGHVLACRHAFLPTSAPVLRDGSAEGDDELRAAYRMVIDRLVREGTIAVNLPVYQISMPAAP